MLGHKLSQRLAEKFPEVYCTIREDSNAELVCRVPLAKWSDGIPWLYSKLLFHYLVTSWTIAGLKQPDSQGETVRYECNGTTR
jgi:hypothetical protein